MMEFDGIVMPALVEGIHVLSSTQNKDVDGRNKSGHDERVFLSENIMFWHYPAVNPPSTYMTWPVQKSDAGESK
jgi:hypothetical protein